MYDGVGQPLMSGWRGRERVVSDSSVSQDYSAGTVPLSVLAMSPLSRPLFCVPLRKPVPLHAPRLPGQAGTRGYSEYFLYRAAAWPLEEGRLQLICTWTV